MVPLHLNLLHAPSPIQGTVLSKLTLNYSPWPNMVLIRILQQNHIFNNHNFQFSFYSLSIFYLFFVSFKVFKLCIIIKYDMFWRTNPLKMVWTFMSQEGGKAKQPWTPWKSLRNPAETVSEPRGKSPNPVRSKKCVILGEIAWFLNFFQHMAQDQTKVLLINAILILFTALVYVYFVFLF